MSLDIYPCSGDSTAYQEGYTWRMLHEERSGRGRREEVFFDNLERTAAAESKDAAVPPEGGPPPGEEPRPPPGREGGPGEAQCSGPPANFFSPASTAMASLLGAGGRGQ